MLPMALKLMLSMTLKLMLSMTLALMLSMPLKCYLLIYRCHCKDRKNSPEKRKRSNNIMETGMIKLRIINLNDFYRRATEPITEKIEEQTRKLGEKIEGQTENIEDQTKPQLAWKPMPLLEPPEEFQDPEPAARPKEKVL